MTELQRPDLSQLRVFTNRGTVAYPFAAKGTDPENGSVTDPAEPRESPTDLYEYGEQVADSLLTQLGAVLFRVDSSQGSAMCYFRAEAENPIQLTAQTIAEDVAAALESLPQLTEQYVTEVRNGTLDGRILEELDPTDDATAFATLTEPETPDIPWDDDLFGHLLSNGPIDISVPSIESGVRIARYLGTHEDYPELTAVVTKGERTASLEDVDVVLSVGDVDDPTFEETARIHRAQLQMISDKVTQRMGPLRNAIAHLATNRVIEERIAATIQSGIETMDVVVKPTRHYHLHLLISGLFGIFIGLGVATTLTARQIFPTPAAISIAIQDAATTLWLIIGSSRLLQAIGGLAGLSVVAWLTIRSVAPGRLPQGPTWPVGTPKESWPTYQELLLGGIAIGLIGAVGMFAAALVFAPI